MFVTRWWNAFVKAILDAHGISEPRRELPVFTVEDRTFDGLFDDLWR